MSEDWKAIRKEAYEDPVFFARFFYPHIFTKPIPWVHRGLMAIILRKGDFLLKYGDLEKIATNFLWQEDPTDDNSPLHPIFEFVGDKVVMHLGRYVLTMMPRGFAKSTTAGFICPSHKILFQDTSFMLYVSETAPLGQMQMGNVKRELETNVRVQNAFGVLRPAMQDPEKWRDDFFETTTGVAVTCRGRGGQVRGLLHNNKRPDWVNVDDLEDKESVLTDAQRLKAREWAYGDLMPVLDEMNENAALTAQGTLLHPDALLMTWAADPQFTTVRFGAHDRQGDLLWEDKMNEAQIAAKKRSYQQAGLLHVFYMEYYNQIRPAELQFFKQEFIRYALPGIGEIQHTAIYLDPAISGKPGADFRAIVLVGMTGKGVIYVLDTWFSRTATPRECIDEYFRLAMKWKCNKHGFEANAFQASLEHLIREEMFRHGYYFEVIKITHSTQKDSRIRGILQPRYSAGYIVHTKRYPELEVQLLDYPNGKKDGPDALAGAIALLDPYAAAAAGNVDLGEDEYLPLEDVLEGEWMQAP